MKLMILDGNSIVNRAFYGIRMLNAPDGTPTNAVYGFLTIFQRILELEQPQAVCVAFDVHAPTFRHEQYALYKAQRKPMPEELVVQMPLLNHRILRQSIKNCMCKSTVIIRCEIFCKENGCNSGCHNDRQNHLLYIVCTQSLFMVCKCLRSIFQKRIPAHQTDCYTK